MEDLYLAGFNAVKSIYLEISQDKDLRSSDISLLNFSCSKIWAAAQFMATKQSLLARSKMMFSMSAFSSSQLDQAVFSPNEKASL